jgi:hypothetical protein
VISITSSQPSSHRPCLYLHRIPGHLHTTLPCRIAAEALNHPRYCCTAVASGPGAPQASLARLVSPRRGQQGPTARGGVQHTARATAAAAGGWDRGTQQRSLRGGRVCCLVWSHRDRPAAAGPSSSSSSTSTTQHQQQQHLAALTSSSSSSSSSQDELPAAPLAQRLRSGPGHPGRGGQVREEGGDRCVRRSPRCC